MVFIIQTVAELFLSPVGLSTTSALAPKSFASQTMRWNRLGGLSWHRRVPPSAATSRTHSWGPPVSSVAPMRSESAHVTWR
ncbi:hypothetical protein BKH29_01610 [Actinomyces oris]|uniref:Uncharacterized protein n=1 Tax=Actinomyces oris TaxID=544580 RepID=A0A1Q8VDJ2_9ACTO|nr:hypothetical protein BKH29_01610 [Actinomyces oris]